MSENILELKRLRKNFGNVEVLKDINLILKKGTILGLVGENGAGKSTMMNLLGGIYQPTSGEILLHEKIFSPKNPLESEKAGIAFIHQELNVFTNLSVAENIFLDNLDFMKKRFFSYSKLFSEAEKSLRSLGLDLNVKMRMEDLSQGNRQIIEVAKAVVKNAGIVIFDEPTTSLSNLEKQKLFSIIKKLKKDNISMIYISHTLEDVMNICDEIAVLRDGSLIAQKDAEILTKAEIIRMMVGRELSNLFPYTMKSPGETALKVENIKQGKKLRNISFVIKEGEIVGLFGLMGAGRTELARAIYGIDKIDSGTIWFGGSRIENPNPVLWNRKGFAFVTEDRRGEGLILTKSVKLNLILTELARLKKRFGALDFKRAEKNCSAMIKKMSIKTTEDFRQKVSELSGGNQQKVVLGKWLMKDLKFLILDEPTKGIDVGSKFDIYNYINDLASMGSGILFISSEMEELMGICDRILIISKGRLTGSFNREEFSSEKIISHALEGGAH